MFDTVKWENDKVYMIDQRKLPNEENYIELTTFREVADAIKKMVIRGAPAIGVAAGMGIALGVVNSDSQNKTELERELEEICETIENTRPTASNLFWAIERMKKTFRKNLDLSIPEIKKKMKKEAIEMKEEDIRLCRMIGQNGAQFLKDGSSVLTHCNAGGLATAGYGTALGVIRGAREADKDIRVYADETRPFLQGARLTTWELIEDDIPVTLITDNMAGHFMNSSEIDAVVVGADRIAANGDVANKIGTYSIAVLAKENDIPFYVAAPVSTIDFEIESGRDIPIEKRDRSEVTQINGEKRIAPEDVDVENPAFDITPAEYVTAIITDKGVISSNFEEEIKRLKNT